MHTLSAPEPTLDSLRELDHVLHHLWAREPDCRFGERHHLLNRLRQLSSEVEQLTIRHSFPGGTPLDPAHLAELIRRTADLAHGWSTEVWVATPWPAGVLGARPGDRAA